MRLSKNFHLHEFERSQTASLFGIDNSVPAGLVPNVQRLVDDVLQPLRDVVGPIFVSSGYRSFEVNYRIGGSLRSQHMQGLAADITCIGKTPLELAQFIADQAWPWDQLIHEFNSWVHVSVAAVGFTPRRQSLTIDAFGTRSGLHEARSRADVDFR